jgi:hypothetical protein
VWQKRYAFPLRTASALCSLARRVADQVGLSEGFRRLHLRGADAMFKSGKEILMLGRVALASALVSLGLVAAAAPATSAGPAVNAAAANANSLLSSVRYEGRRYHRRYGRYHRHYRRHYQPYYYEPYYSYTPNYSYSYEYDPGYGYGYGEDWSDAEYGYYGSLDSRESCEFWRKICVARWGWGNSNYAQCKLDHGC